MCVDSHTLFKIFSFLITIDTNLLFQTDSWVEDINYFFNECQIKQCRFICNAIVVMFKKGFVLFIIGYSSILLIMT